jgi:Prolyl oligopeptidase family
MALKITRRRTFAMTALAVLALAACGGGGDSDPVRGGLVGVDDGVSLTRAQIDAAATGAGTAALVGPATCDVTTKRLRYQTQDPRGNVATASVAVMIPTGANQAACGGSRPVVVYTHGTTTLKSFNMANLAANGEAALVAAMYAAQGFIVIAPNYLGYDTSSLPYHPYLNAENSAVDVIDGMRAARAYLNSTSAVRPANRYFVTGYSQGGHVAMAVHKVLERDHATEFPLTASVPMSGPYNLVGFGDIVTTVGPVNGGATIFVPLLLTSYQRSYGDIYANPTDAYQAPFAATAETLFPTDTPVDTLKAQNRLPNPDPGSTQLFGVGGLLTDAFRASYLTSNYRNTLVRTSGLPANLDWTPRAPLALCGGAQDPVVFWAANTPVAQAYLNSRLPVGAPPIPAWDLESRASLPGATGTPAGAASDGLFAGWQAAKTAQGVNLTGAYHGLAAPFCSALARGYFQQILVALAAQP